MFLGHFALGFAAKKINSKPSLGTYFFAAQFLDLLWPTLLLLGIEKVEIGSRPGNPVPLSFTHYPISHSLVAVIGWGILFGGIYFLFTKRKTAAVILGLCVISHWFLDLIVHIPDLPLYPGSTLVGLGLWKSQTATLILETILFAGGVLIYTSVTKAINRTGKFALIGLVIFLVGVHIANIFGEAPPGVTAVAWAGQLQWLLVFWGYWVDGKRKAKVEAQQSNAGTGSVRLVKPEKEKSK